MNKIKLSTYAKKNNLCYRTAYNYFRAGTLKGEQLTSGTILVYDNEKNKTENEKIAIYYKKSTSDNNQIKRVSDFCAAHGWIINKIIIENEFNNKRPKFVSLLEDTSVTKIVIEHNDMFCSLGIESIRILLKSQGRELIAINETKDLNETG